VTTRWSASVLLFAIMAAHALLETARDAVFLAKLGSDALALGYLAIAALALVTLAIVKRTKLAPRGLLVAVLVIGAIGTFVMSATLSAHPAMAFVLYLWTGVIITVALPSFWLVAEHGWRMGNAKRNLAFIATGGALGALAGSAVAFVLARFFDANTLVTIAGVGYTLATLAAAKPCSRATAPARLAEEQREGAAPASYARLLLLLGVVATITLTLGDLMFKRVLAERLPADDLASWLAAIYTALNLLGLGVQFFVTTRILQRASVGTALTVLPVLVLVSALGFIAGAALVAVIVLKLADGSLRHNLHRVASEILFIPLGVAARDRVKPIIDTVAQRGGQALAAIAALLFATDARALAVTLVAGVPLWIAVLAVVRRAYVRRFRAGLAAHDVQRDVQIPALDAASVAMLTSTLASPDEAEAAAALDLLATRKGSIPPLVLYHPSPAIVRRALDLLRGELPPDVARVLEHLVAHGDPQIRAAAIAASSRNGVHPQTAGLRDAAADVRAASAVALAAREESAHAVISSLATGDTHERTAIARAIGRAPDPAFRDILVELARTRDPAVVREVLQTWQRVPELANRDVLLSLLADPHVRGDVRRTFVAIGDLDPLASALDDPRTQPDVRRHLPRTLSRFRSPASAAVLVARLLREPDGTTEFKILRALGRMRADDPELPIAKLPMQRYVWRALEDAGRYRRIGGALIAGDRSPTLDLIHELLAEKRAQAIERAFRALAIMHPGAGLRGVYEAMVGEDAEDAAGAREILDEVLPADTRAQLVDELEGHDPAHVPTYTYETALRALLVDRSDTLRCIVAHHVAEHRLVMLRDDLVRLGPETGSTLVTLAFDQAIERLHV
jgi:ATP:ADP antiporter, AAA family